MRDKRGPRTHPTTKPMVSMNRRDLGSVEVRLGVIQVVIMLGVVTGCMACAFFLGFNSGKDSGFERAMDESLASSARLPIASEEIEDNLPDEMVSKVYAKLSDTQEETGKRKRRKNRDPEDMPQIGSIETTDVAPVVVTSADDSEPAGAGAVKNSLEVNEQIGDTEDKTDSLPGIRLLGSDSEANDTEQGLSFDKLEQETESSQKSLGELLKDKEQNAEMERVRAKAALREREKEKTQEVARLTESDLRTKIPVSNQRPVSPEFPSKNLVDENRSVKPKAQTPVLDSSVGKAIQAPRLGETTPSSTKVPSGWYAQVAAPRDAKDAKGLSDRLRGSGFSPVIEIARVRGEQYYRVLVGPEGSRSHAERLLGQLKRESYLKGDPFIKLVR